MQCLVPSHVEPEHVKLLCGTPVSGTHHACSARAAKRALTRAPHHPQENPFRANLRPLVDADGRQLAYILFRKVKPEEMRTVPGQECKRIVHFTLPWLGTGVTRHVVFQRTGVPAKELEAYLSLIQTTFIIFLLSFGSISFSQDTQKKEVRKVYETKEM